MQLQVLKSLAFLPDSSLQLVYDALQLLEVVVLFPVRRRQYVLSLCIHSVHEFAGLESIAEEYALHVAEFVEHRLNVRML